MTFFHNKNIFQMSLISPRSDSRKLIISASIVLNQQFNYSNCRGQLYPKRYFLRYRCIIYNTLFYITFVHSKNTFQKSIISPGSDNRKWRFSDKSDKSAVHTYYLHCQYALWLFISSMIGDLKRFTLDIFS